MKFGKTPMVAAALAAVIGATAVGAGAVSAAGTTGSGNGPFTDIAQAIATHFNVDQTEVQTIIDGQMEVHRAEREAEHQTQMAERLAKAVQAGKLTQEQADALTAHQADMKTGHEALRDLSPEEARQQIEAHREEMDSWLEEQGIDKEVLREVMGEPGGRGMGGHRGPGRHHGLRGETLE